MEGPSIELGSELRAGAAARASIGLTVPTRAIAFVTDPRRAGAGLSGAAFADAINVPEDPGFFTRFVTTPPSTCAEFPNCAVLNSPDSMSIRVNALLPVFASEMSNSDLSGPETTRRSPGGVATSFCALPVSQSYWTALAGVTIQIL